MPVPSMWSTQLIADKDASSTSPSIPPLVPLLSEPEVKLTVQRFSEGRAPPFDSFLQLASPASLEEASLRSPWDGFSALGSSSASPRAISGQAGNRFLSPF